MRNLCHWRGYAGLTTARELARNGHNVVLLESKCVGWGASGRNAGFVSAGFSESMESIAHKIGQFRANVLYQLSLAGREYIRETVNELGLDNVILGNGWLTLLRNGSIDSLKKAADQFANNFGVDLQVVKKSELGDYVRSPKYLGGLLDRDAFHIHPLRYAQALAADVTKSGGKIFEDSKCIKLHRLNRDKNGVWHVKSRLGRIECENVVLATSAYDGPFPQLNRAVIPVTTYAVSSEIIGKNLNSEIMFNGCISDTRRSGDYYRVVDRGSQSRLIWGGRITTHNTNTKLLAKMLLKDITSVYPQLSNIKIDKAWSGLMGYSIHKMPIIAQLDKGLWSATAFGGQGLNTTAMAGQLISEAILKTGDQYKLLSPFGPNWSGGILGSVATQLEYWRLRYLDRRDENAWREPEG